jgi:8-oxo-dGTP diphosphatase
MPKYCYDYPRPAVTADLVAFALQGSALRLLLVRRGHDPFQGCWALPGGFVNMDEPLEAAARRELCEETGLECNGPVGLVDVFGDPGRDPRGRVISIIFGTAVRGPLPHVDGGDDAAEAAWLDPRKIQGLAFDHDEIVKRSLEWLAREVAAGPMALALLPAPFDDNDVRNLFRAMFGSARGALAWRKTMQKRQMIEVRRGKEMRYYAREA